MFGLLCRGCGRPLEAESHAGPPRRWFATRDELFIAAANQGWVDDGRTCPTCREAADER